MGFLDPLGLKRIVLKGDKQHVPLLVGAAPEAATPGASPPAVATPAAVVAAAVAPVSAPPGGAAPLTGFRERNSLFRLLSHKGIIFLKRKNCQGFGRWGATWIRICEVA